MRNRNSTNDLIVPGALPITVPKTIRAEEIRHGTSFRAGKIVPHAAIPLLREDRVTRGSFNLQFDMAETVHPLMNSVGVEVSAHLIPWAAFERFPSMEGFNKSYLGLKDREADAAPIPFFGEGVTYDKTDPFWKALGKHYPNNTVTKAGGMYLEAYNLLVNWLYRKRSKELPVRDLDDTSFAQAFWNNPLTWHIKPDFDQAMMEGEIDLSFSQAQATVHGIGTQTSGQGAPASLARRDSDGVTYTQDGWVIEGAADTPGAGESRMVVKRHPTLSSTPDIWADLAGAGIKVSLANIELAKQIAAFAKSRDKYKGLTERDIDLLMQGIHVPDDHLREPILLDRKRSIFGYTERHAMDGDNLDQSVTVGKTAVSLNFFTPPINTGGIIIITSQVVPEQLFERKRDIFMYAETPADLPRFDRDYLDPEKVDVIPNAAIDALHGTPAGTFGYGPLNSEWKTRSFTHLGGKFFRPVPDAFVEDRQRFWTVETTNPALNTAWYLVPSDLPHSVFADTVADPFEVVTLGGCQIVGNTVFGDQIEEDQGSYDAVEEVVDTGRIDQDA